MRNPRNLGVFSATFAVVLFAGIAFAQVGAWAPQAPEPAEAAFAPGTEYVASSAPTTTVPALPTAPAQPAGTTATSPFASTTTAPAPFLITFPVDGDRFVDQYVTFTGTAPAGWTVTAAGYAATREGLTWSIRLILSPGRNDATLYATSPDGVITQEATVTAYYDVPSVAAEPVTAQTAPTGTADAPTTAASFTAHQKYGENQAPFDVFWGEGRPGDTIRVFSDYGGAETRVGPKGFWDMRVSFRDAPVDRSFVVTIQDGTGASYDFTFVWLGGPDGDDGEGGDHESQDEEGGGHEESDQDRGDW